MRIDLMGELGREIIVSICEKEMTLEEVAVTLDCIIEAIESSILLDAIPSLLSGEIISEAEDILQEAFENSEPHRKAYRKGGPNVYQ